MKTLIMVSALVLGIVASSPAQTHAATPVLQGAPARASLSTLSVPLVSSLALQVAGRMVQGATATIQQAQQKPTLDVNINVDKGERRWAVSPMWLAIGGLALLVLVALIVMVSRGTGGTTVVRG
jgi:hypothetical protein